MHRHVRAAMSSQRVINNRFARGERWRIDSVLPSINDFRKKERYRRYRRRENDVSRRQRRDIKHAKQHGNSHAIDCEIATAERYSSRLDPCHSSSAPRRLARTLRHSQRHLRVDKGGREDTIKRGSTIRRLNSRSRGSDLKCMPRSRKREGKPIRLESRRLRREGCNYSANTRRNIAADLIVPLAEHAGRPSNKELSLEITIRLGAATRGERSDDRAIGAFKIRKRLTR